MSLLQTLRQTARGAMAIDGWLGDGGKPVSQEMADDRAKACAMGNEGFPCPFNKSPYWWDKFTDKIALAIRDMLSVKSECEMVVRSEDTIHMCSVCGCCLKLKVWCPVKHVKESVPIEKLKTTPAYCWMRKEILG